MGRVDEIINDPEYVCFYFICFFLGLSRFFSDVSLPQVLIYILFYLGQDIIIDYYSMSHAATSLSSLLLMIDQAHQL